jgi:hypothetical protein
MVVRAVEGVVPGDNPPYLMDPNGWFLQGSRASAFAASRSACRSSRRSLTI